MCTGRMNWALTFQGVYFNSLILSFFLIALVSQSLSSIKKKYYFPLSYLSPTININKYSF